MNDAATRPPLLMRRDEVISIKRAAAHAMCFPDTVRRWYHDDGIGRQAGPNAPVQISIVALEMRMCWDRTALRAYLAGDRGNPLVIRYFDHLGPPP